MDIKKLVEEYRLLTIELEQYKKAKQGLILKYKEIRKYITISDTTVTHIRGLHSFYTERCECLEGQLKRVERLLKTLDEPYYTIMYKRYIEGKKLETVADETYYNYRTIITKIKKAFEMLGGVGNERNRENSEKSRSIAG